MNKILVAAISGELSSGLSTAYFLRLLKKVSGKDPTDFAEQWIFSPGMPILNCEYFFSRKKNAIELRVRQDTTRPRYIGPLTVRVHEPTGTFDHVVNISEYNQKFELLYHTKYKRIRNSKKAQVLAAQDEAEKDKQESILGLRPPAGTEADEEMCRTDPELLAELNKTEEETDHAESEEISEINSSIAWIRFDPNLELPCKIVCKQTEFAWIQQLYRDKDVIAQFEAAKNLSNYPSEKSCYCLFKLLMDVRSNYRVRMEAAYALAKGFRGTDQEIKVFNLLALAFRKKFSIQKSIDVPLPDIVPRRNDFSAFTEYFVQKAIIMSFSLICTSENTEIVGDIQKFIVSQLQLNDNSQNSFSDHNYIASLILALGYSFLPPSVWDWDSSSTQHGQQWVTNVISERASSELLDEAMKEIYRYLFLETQIPSAQNVVARACLEVLVNWSLSSLIPVRIQHFILFSNRENFAGVRIHSFEAIIVFAGHNRSVSNYLMDTMENDFDLNIRIAVAKCLNRWLRALTRLLVNFEKFALSNMQQKSLESSNFDIEDLANESLESESSSRKLKQKIENILQSYRDNFKTWIWKCLTYVFVHPFVFHIPL